MRPIRQNATAQLRAAVVNLSPCATTQRHISMWGRKMSYRSLLVLLVLFCFSLATISAQTVTGSITGSLIDPHGAVVPDAKVTLTSESTGAVRQINSDQRGEFTFNALPPDTYTLTVEHAGFKPEEELGT